VNSRSSVPDRLWFRKLCEFQTPSRLAAPPTCRPRRLTSIQRCHHHCPSARGNSRSGSTVAPTTPTASQTSADQRQRSPNRPTNSSGVALVAAPTPANSPAQLRFLHHAAAHSPTRPAISRSWLWFDSTENTCRPPTTPVSSQNQTSRGGARPGSGTCA
jgi:hypothetical protein